MTVTMPLSGTVCRSLAETWYDQHKHQIKPFQRYLRGTKNLKLGHLGVTHRVYLWLDGKCIVDFLLVIIELFTLALS